MYGHDVFKCLYDEQPACERFQPECKDEGNVVCSPRVVNLGAFDPRPALSDPHGYGYVEPVMPPAPAPSTLPLMGP